MCMKITLVLWVMTAIAKSALIILDNSLSSEEKAHYRFTDNLPIRCYVSAWIYVVFLISAVVMTIISIIKI